MMLHYRVRMKSQEAASDVSDTVILAVFHVYMDSICSRIPTPQLHSYLFLFQPHLAVAIRAVDNVLL